MQNTKALNTIIRSSLAAASAALEILDLDDTPAVVEVGSCAAVMPACESYSPVVADAAEAAPKSQFEKLMDELNDPRYTLRSVSELCAKTGYDYQSDIEEVLADYGVEFVNRVRRRDGAALIGLASRN